MQNTPQNHDYTNQYVDILKCENLLKEFIRLYISLKNSHEVQSGIIKFKTPEEVSHAVFDSLTDGITS